MTIAMYDDCIELALQENLWLLFGMSKTPCQLQYQGISELHTMDSGLLRAVRADELESLKVIKDAAVVVDSGVITAIGGIEEITAAYSPEKTIDLGGQLLVPGLIDAHTHPAFVVGRAEEFDWRAAGISYVEIAKRGGGILSSVAAVRAASEEQLTQKVVEHFQRMQACGTVACEAKSGYGLTVADELKSLRAIAAAAAHTKMEVFPTFLGAHMIPQEHKEQPDRWLEILCEEGLPAAKDSGLARAADVFVESHALNLERSSRYLVRAKELGFALRIHADQFEALGAVDLGVELEAESVDHLEALNDTGLASLATSQSTFAGLLPAVPHFLRQNADAPAGKLLRAGVPWFVATDFNPGSCYSLSLLEAAHFARVRLCMSAQQVLAGMTTNAAYSLGAGDYLGRIAPNYKAKFTALAISDIYHFGYSFGENYASSLGISS